MKIIAISENGYVKSNNEDTYLINDSVFIDSNTELSENASVFVVFDGIGGNSSGEVAAKVASEYFASKYKDILLSNEDSLKDIIEQANSEVLKYATTDTHNNGMGTTLAGMILLEDRWIVFNVGDSRVYRLRNGLFKYFSVDDSYFNYLKSMGLVKEEDSEKYANNHKITAYLGNPHFDKEQIHVFSIDFGVRAGDTFLLCTDGVSDMVDDDTMRSILESGHSIRHLSEQIRQHILKAGAMDNFTYILVQMEDSHD